MDYKTVLKIKTATLFLSGFDKCFNMKDDEKKERINKIAFFFNFNPNEEDTLLYLMLGELRDKLAK